MVVRKDVKMKQGQSFYAIDVLIVGSISPETRVSFSDVRKRLKEVPDIIGCSAINIDEVKIVQDGEIEIIPVCGNLDITPWSPEKQRFQDEKLRLWSAEGYVWKDAASGLKEFLNEPKNHEEMIIMRKRRGVA